MSYKAEIGYKKVVVEVKGCVVEVRLGDPSNAVTALVADELDCLILSLQAARRRIS